MSSTIDPTTGYPLVSPVTIDYLPLNVQTFPFPDMSTGQGPSRGSTYPDDIFSVMGHVAGYRQDNPRQDQVVYTDGKHALWVYQVNASGGGGALPPQAIANFQQFTYTGSTGAGKLLFGGIGPTLKVYTFSIAVGVIPSSITGAGYIHWRVYVYKSTDGGAGIALADGVITYGSGDVSGSHSQVSHVYPGTFDVAGSDPDSGGSYNLLIDSGNVGASQLYASGSMTWN